MKRSPRPSRAAIISQLKLAARKGDRVALTLATDQMKTWAYSPRYWQKYLQLLTHPLARLVDLTVIKQGEKIAHQKGWKLSRRPSKPCANSGRPAARPPRMRNTGSPIQPSLFPDLTP
ncbi:MAG TPA: hypothetical protein VMS64_09520 [Candidatus Methylomirabilis sp.]|nr:hypothetical protein [Candidatus Methylomirabilis sp.]